jgi:subtilisin-like proprotein convertase family protein
MHVIVTNYLGLQHRGFAMDRTFDYEVWNQPVVGYEITRQREITAAEANRLLGREGETYTYNPDATRFYDVNMSLRWITESHASMTPADAARYTRTDYLTYILEVDANGRIIGGEWYGNSRNSHPDFLWNPRRLTRSSVPYLNIDNVRMLIEMSRRAEPPAPMPGTAALSANGAGGLAIPDNSSTGIRSEAAITGGMGGVTAVRVTVDLTHPYVGDLEVELEHGNVRRMLHNREGGAADDIRRTFDVVGFEGVDPNGPWVLHVRDRARADVGRLNSWSLEVTAGGSSTPVAPTPTTEARFAGMGGIAIPDNDTTGITSTASVTGAPTSGRAVAIEVNVTHTYVGDLSVSVTAPNGRSFTLHNRTGGSDQNLRQTFPLDATGNAFTGDPNGTWTLRVVDAARVDVGTLDGWAVIVR